MDAWGLEALAVHVRAGGVLVLSGSGLSTTSGIPDYRGPTGSLHRHTPMTYQLFTSGPEQQRRYWARSHLGWRRFARAAPNLGHLAVTRLQEAGLLNGVVTQNVDGLHETAGARGVIDLHGRLDRVACLGCGARSSREALDLRLTADNEGWSPSAGAPRPDGDIELDAAAVESFRFAGCESCGGVLKPDVVFFGENVEREVVERTYALVEGSSALLVLGSSLTVMSGYRFALRAAKLGVPVVVVNQGPTRADHLAALKVEAPLQEAMPGLVSALALVGAD